MRLCHPGLSFVGLMTCSAFISLPSSPSLESIVSRRRTPVTNVLFKNWRNSPNSSRENVGMDMADESMPVVGGEGLNAFSKPITVEKYEKLQSRRVVVTITYSTGIGYTNLFEACNALIKKEWPDVIVVRNRISGQQEPTFEIMVDNRLIFTKRPDNVAVYLQKAEIDLAIRAARRRLRPKDVYGEPDTFDSLDADLVQPLPKKTKMRAIRQTVRKVNRYRVLKNKRDWSYVN